MARVYLENLTKIFEGKVLAVDKLTLEIPDKGLVSLLGPSGCGKTTTMRMIAGLETPTEGKIYFNEQDVTDIPPEDRNVAMVFQFPVVYPGMTVFENIAFPLVARKTPRNEIQKRVEEVADIFGILDVLPKKAHLLDAGTKQKVVLARTFVRRPHVYLLDEPLTSVDPSTRVELRTVLKKLQSHLGQTMVYVTHDQSEALTLADRIAVMNEGRLLQYGSPEEVYNNPKNTFVGYFLGNPGMNFINCSVEEERGSCILDAEDFRVLLPDMPVSFLRDFAGRKVVFGIRPENLEISTQPVPEAIPFLVILVEPVGNRLVVHLKKGEKVLKAKVPRQEIALQQEVWVRFPPEFLKVFDGETLEAVEI